MRLFVVGSCIAWRMHLFHRTGLLRLASTLLCLVAHLSLDMGLHPEDIDIMYNAATTT
jgi:hypothetical protein